jgi:hypothetical protein
MMGPGLLLAATGVGGGDLATGSFVGSLLGTAVLWAVLVGALLKFVVTEGLARWQLATGETLIEGAVARLGPVVVWLFLPYLLLWSFFVGSAQMSACGVALHAMMPIFDDADDGKIAFGVLSGLIGVALVWRGGYRAGVIHTDFERGFIRAQTIGYTDFVTLGGEVPAKEAGKARDEGKEYIVQDGDVLLFRFNT